VLAVELRVCVAGALPEEALVLKVVPVAGGAVGAGPEVRVAAEEPTVTGGGGAPPTPGVT